MKTDIWMPLYIGDYLADTSRLTTEQHGAYLLLIMDYWRNGRLPDNDAILANISRLSPESWKKNRGVLQGFFEGKDGEWVHARIEQEKDKSGDLKKAQVKKSIIGNYVKYGKIDPRVTEDAYFKAWWEQEMVKHTPKVSLKDSPKAPPLPSPLPSYIKDIKDIEAKAPKTKSTRLPDDWELPDEWAIWCKENRKDLNPNQVAEQFKDYWLSVPHSKGLKADWLATWRNWCRNQKTSTKQVSFAEQDELNKRKKWEEMTGLQWPDNNDNFDSPRFIGIQQ